jgi:hypothetical protein
MMSKHAEFLKVQFLKDPGKELSNKERKLRERMLKKATNSGRAKDPYKRGRKAMKRHG